MKSVFIIFVVVLSLASTQSVSDAGWLIYHKPEFRGKVIDADTKEPIEGAVVVVIYNKYSLIGGPGGGYSTIIKVKETLTDKNGEFYFPSYTTIIQPLSKEDYAEFIIYKPGYKSYGIKPLSDLPTSVQEIFFSEGTIGKKGEIREGDPVKIHQVTFGIVELPRVKMEDFKERANALPSAPTDFGAKELPLLFRAINEERRSLGLQEVKY